MKTYRNVNIYEESDFKDIELELQMAFLLAHKLPDDRININSKNIE